MSKGIILAALLGSAAALTASAGLNPGEKSLGVKLGYGSHNQSAVTGLTFQYALSSHVRLAPEIGCAFRNKHEDAFMMDLNVHVPFGLVESDKVSLYPLGGVTFNSWAKHGVTDADGADVTNHVNRFGLNFGAGFDLRCSSTLQLNIEAKYSLVKSFSAAYVTAGISYVF